MRRHPGYFSEKSRRIVTVYSLPRTTQLDSGSDAKEWDTSTFNGVTQVRILATASAAVAQWPRAHCLLPRYSTLPPTNNYTTATMRR